MAILAERLQTLEGELAVAFGFAAFWCVFVEVARRKLADVVRSAPWWPSALPSQVSVMVNFGFPKGKVTEDVAVYGFVWIITMCITHVVSASMMVPVVALGWAGAGATGQLCFLLGTLSEVGFDIYDWTKLFLLTFARHPLPCLGPRHPLKTFVLIGLFHHTTVLGMTIPMNLHYPSLAAYHRVAFSLLFSAGVCFLVGQYKFTIDGRTERGLACIKKIMAVQFVMNWLARVVVWFPSIVSGLATFRSGNDTAFFYGGLAGVVGMSLYNVVVVMDATQASLKWWRKSVAVAKEQ